jgi:hypothetical protein
MGDKGGNLIGPTTVMLDPQSKKLNENNSSIKKKPKRGESPKLKTNGNNS